MGADPIAAFESLGYTEREAAFLYLVAIHSGYFVRRQFDYFTDRNKGALVMRFLQKAGSAGHIEVLDYGLGWHVYHLAARTLYCILGNVDSQNRRRKGDAQIRARLMALDYVLDHDSDRYLESAEEKVRFFTQLRGATHETITDEHGRLYPFLSSMPVGIVNRSQPAQSLVRFAFIDEGLATVTKFTRFLSALDPLLRTVGNFELIYVATSNFNFSAAEAAFRRQFLSRSVQAPSLFEKHSQGMARSASKSSVPFCPQFTTLLLRSSFPRLRRNADGVLIGVHKERA